MKFNLYKSTSVVFFYSYNSRSWTKLLWFSVINKNFDSYISKKYSKYELGVSKSFNFKEL